MQGCCRQGQRTGGQQLGRLQFLHQSLHGESPVWQLGMHIWACVAVSHAAGRVLQQALPLCMAQRASELRCL